MKNLIKNLIISALLVAPPFLFYFKKDIIYLGVKDKIFKIETEMGSSTGYQLKYKNNIYLITNAHVCLVDEIAIDISSGFPIPQIVGQHRAKSIKANGLYTKIVHISNSSDLCILRAVGPHAFRLGNLRGHEPLIIAGHPKGFPLKIHFTSAMGYGCEKMPWILNEDDCTNYFILDTPIYRGHSGSPVLDIFGNVVGTIFATTGITGWAIPNTDLLRTLSELENDVR